MAVPFPPAILLGCLSTCCGFCARSPTRSSSSRKAAVQTSNDPGTAAGDFTGLLYVSGAGSTVALTSCSIRCVGAGATCAGMALDEGGCAQMDQCTVTCKGQGMVVQDANSHVELTDCALDGSLQTNMVVQKGASAILERCTLSDSQSGFGLSVDGVDTCVQLANCLLDGNALSNILVQRARVALDGCTLSNSKEGEGMYVEYPQCSIVASECSFLDNKERGVFMLGGARVELRRCTLTGNGSGSAGFYEDTVLEARGCTFSTPPDNVLDVQP